MKVPFFGVDFSQEFHELEWFIIFYFVSKIHEIKSWLGDIGFLDQFYVGEIDYFRKESYFMGEVYWFSLVDGANGFNLSSFSGFAGFHSAEESFFEVIKAIFFVSGIQDFPFSKSSLIDSIESSDIIVFLLVSFSVDELPRENQLITLWWRLYLLILYCWPSEALLPGLAERPCFTFSLYCKAF